MNKADIDRRSDLVWKTLILFEAVMFLVKPLRFRPLAHCLAFLVITITSWQVLRKANIFTMFPSNPDNILLLDN